MQDQWLFRSRSRGGNRVSFRGSKEEVDRHVRFAQSQNDEVEEVTFLGDKPAVAAEPVAPKKPKLADVDSRGVFRRQVG